MMPEFVRSSLYSGLKFLLYSAELVSYMRNPASSLAESIESFNGLIQTELTLSE